MSNGVVNRAGLEMISKTTKIDSNSIIFVLVKVAPKNTKKEGKDKLDELKKSNIYLWLLLIELKNKFDKQQEINIFLFLTFLKSQKYYGLNEINVDAILNQPLEELKSKAEQDPSVAKQVDIVAAKVYLVLKEKEYLNQDITKEKEQLQQACYVSGRHTFDSVLVNDLDIPYHPLEAKLLKLMGAIKMLGNIPKGGSPLNLVNFEGKPSAYTPRHELGAVGFLKEEYKEYLEKDVLYQDTIRKIDPSLYRALRNAIKNKNGVSSSEELEKIIPTKKARSKKNKRLLEKSDSLNKAYRVRNLQHQP